MSEIPSGQRKAAAAELPLAAAEALKLFPGLAGTVLVAVSGGPDSMALLGLLVEDRAALGIALHAATVDHQLRVESAGEAKQVAAFCAQHGVPHVVLAWTGKKPTNGLQAAARAARYDLLHAHAKQIGAKTLLTGHTADDQAETVLMRIAAGTGIAGLAAMRESTERDGLMLVRPFLHVAKSRLIATCIARGWPYCLDSTNTDPRFKRPQLRAASVALDAIGLDPERLGQLAHRAAEAEDALMHAARLLATEALRLDGSLDAHQLFTAPMAVARRAFQLRLDDAARLVDRPHIPLRLQGLERATDRMVDALRSGKALFFNVQGMAITLSKDGAIRFAPEPVRHRGQPKPQA
jgi:tRNA(Ile)-lysidine synthase